MFHRVRIGTLLGALVFILILSVGAAASTPENDWAAFRSGIQDQLKNLSQEIDQLKNREKNIPPEKKAAFNKDVTHIKSKWQGLNDTVTDLKESASKKLKKDLSTRVASLEQDLDRAEDDYSEQHLGLGELLGF